MSRVHADEHTDGTGRREAARQAYRDSIAAGRPLSRRELAARFGYSRSWSRDRINEVRDQKPKPDRWLAKPAFVEWDNVRSGEPDDARQGHRQHLVDRPAQQEPAVGRRVAWLAFIVGVAASVAANVMHAQIVSTNRAAWVGAAFWPTALLLAIEVLARVSWPHRSVWHRLVRYAGTSMVATVAAVLSYRHMAGLLATWGEDTLSSYLGPLAVDGLMILAAAALLTKRTDRPAEHQADQT